MTETQTMHEILTDFKKSPSIKVSSILMAIKFDSAYPNIF